MRWVSWRSGWFGQGSMVRRSLNTIPLKCSPLPRIHNHPHRAGQGMALVPDGHAVVDVGDLSLQKSETPSR